MKKFIGFLIVLSLFVLGGLKVQAAVNPNTPCASTATPSITVLSPNGGEEYTTGGIIETKWKSCNIPANSQMSIGLYVAETGQHYYFAGPHDNFTPNDGEEEFIIPTNVPAGKYTLNIVTSLSPSGPGIIDYSDSKFTVNNSNSNSKPQVTVLSPNGGENYTVGQQITVKWTTTNISTSEKVVIILDPSPETAPSQDGYNISGSIGTINDGIETYTLNSDVYGKFKIRILQLNNNAVKDSSDGFFTIGQNTTCSISSAPSITVLSPNGGEVYTVGQNVNFTWKSCNIPSTVHLNVQLISESNPEDSLSFLCEGGSSTWGEACLNDGQQKLETSRPGVYKLNIVTREGVTVSDMSDNSFTITNSAISTVLSDGCKIGNIYSSTTGKKCSTQTIELKQKCNSTTGCIKTEVPMEMKVCDSAAGCYSMPVSRVLKIGVKGEDVKYIQTLLGITADGSYGPITASKVKEWQASKKLKADGIFGPKSMSIISQ